MTTEQVESWLSIATERVADADSINKARPTSLGSIYLVGYGIECSLKALLESQGKPFPKSGSEGHNLRGLWESCHFRLSDLSDPQGAKAFFIEQWDTSLRYKMKVDMGGMTTTELLDAGKQLIGFLKNNIRRQRGKRP